MSEKKQFDPNELQEIKKAPERPSKLYRAFTINPESLTLELLRQPLKPGKHAVDDPTRIGDGNELGVYMSTNSYMVEKVYASGGRPEGCYILTERYVDKSGAQMVSVPLPACGIVIEVDTATLPIREPKMIPALQGHYNNGFEGYEWIADEIPADRYHVTRLILSNHSNDSKKITIDVSEMDEAELQGAIDTIKAEFAKVKQAAEEFKAFLEGLTPQQRMNSFLLQRLWVKHQEESKLQ